MTVLDVHRYLSRNGKIARRIKETSKAKFAPKLDSFHAKFLKCKKFFSCKISTGTDYKFVINVHYYSTLYKNLGSHIRNVINVPLSWKV